MNIGFIGLGVMGKPMSKNLIKAGYSLFVYNRSVSAVQELVQLGAKKAQSPKELASLCEVVITMLPNSPEVKEVVLGANGVLEGARPGTILIDTSSIAPGASQEIAHQMAQKGVRMLDAPVSGGEPKAVSGTLAFMVGGRETDFEECRPIFAAMGSSYVLCGEVGAGNVTKLANQTIVAVNIAAMSEALVLATKAGVDPERVYEAIRGGLAGSTVLEAKAPLIFKRNFEPGFRLELHIKDLNNVLETGHLVGSSLPLTALVLEMMQAARVEGLEKADHSALIQFYERLAHVVVQ